MAINDSIKQMERRAQLVAVADGFASLPSSLNLIEPHRSFVKQGALVKICRKSRKERHFFLFNDLLLYASEALSGGKYTLHGHMDLMHVRIDDVPDSEPRRVQHAFQIVGPKKSFVVLAPAAADKVAWMLAIADAVAAWKASRAQLLQRQQHGHAPAAGAAGQEAAEAPVWIPDADAKACAVCAAEFTFFTRRHHCRSCGACVCGDCSEKKLLLPAISKEPVRVCERCYASRAPPGKDRDADKNTKATATTFL